MDGTKKRHVSKIDLTVFAKNALMFCYSLLLGLCELSNGVYPFGMALLCSQERYTFPVFAGVFTAGILTGTSRYLAVLLAMLVFMVKWVVSRKGLKQPVVLKMLLSVSCGAVIAVCEFIDKNILFDNIYTAITVFAALPLCTLLFCGYYVKSGKMVKVRNDIAYLAFAFVTVKALGLAEVGTFSPAAVAAVVITVYFARGSYIFGGLCGFICGMAADIVYIPILGIMGICVGIFFESGKAFSVIFAFLLSVTAGAYLVGVENSIPGIVNPFIGILIFLLISKRLPARTQTDPVGSKSKQVPLAKLSGAFSSLSSVFYTVSENTVAETKTELHKHISDKVFTLCNKCNGCGCDKYDLINHMTDTASKKGIIFFDDLPGHIRGMCHKGGELLYAANSVRSEKELKGTETIKGLADEYLSFSRLLCSLNEKNELENYSDTRRNKRTAEFLSGKGIQFKAVRVTGQNKIEIEVGGVDVQSMKCTANDIRFGLSKLLMTELSTPEFVYDEGIATMRLETVPKLKVECAKAVFNKHGETVCGDTVSFFENDNGSFYALLSDGMGSGHDAALTSRLAAIFIEKLLSVGADKAEVLNMLNKTLVSKNQEVFTTIDLLEIDKLTGEASIVKAGAAPTFLYRNNTCFRLEAKTPPAGIIDSLHAVQTKMKICKGDCIVMLSDGLLPSEDKPPLPTRQNISAKRTAAVLAANIIEQWGAGTSVNDDRSVCVIRVF